MYGIALPRRWAHCTLLGVLHMLAWVRNILWACLHPSFLCHVFCGDNPPAWSAVSILMGVLILCDQGVIVLVDILHLRGKGLLFLQGYFNYMTGHCSCGVINLHDWGSVTSAKFVQPLLNTPFMHALLQHSTPHCASGVHWISTCLMLWNT